MAKYRIVRKFDQYRLYHYYRVEVHWLCFWIIASTRKYLFRDDAEDYIKLLVGREKEVKRNKAKNGIIAIYDKNGNHCK